MSKDYSNSRFFAISGIGYGKGDSPVEAIENYVASQLRNIPFKSTVFKTKAEFEEALRTGSGQAVVWKAPEGATGFVLGMGLRWEMSDGQYVLAVEDDQVVCATCGETLNGATEAHSDPEHADTHEFTAR
jgi:hypothetical protein